MSWPRKKRIEVSTDSVATAAASTAEASALLGALQRQSDRVDSAVARSQREVRLNGFTNRIERAMAMPYPGLGTVTGTE